MHPTIEKSILHAALGVILLAMVSCGGDSNNHGGSGGSGPPTPSTLDLAGTAAVGAAIQAGTVTAECADGSGLTSVVTTNIDGSWTGEIDSKALPCAMTVTGGTPSVTLRSFTSLPGTINITPITDMVLALATGSADGSWISTRANWPDASTIATRKTELLTAMTNAGFTLPSGDPFTTELVVGDSWDQVLDAVQEAIENDPSIADYSALLSLVADGHLDQFPAAPEDEGSEEPELPASLHALTDHAGTYTVIGDATGDPGYCASCGTANRNHVRRTVIISTDGDVDFDTGIIFTVSEIVSIFDRKDTAVDRHVLVNYGESENDERIRLYFNSDLDIMEIIHDDEEGVTTRALIQKDETDPNPDLGPELLGMRNGVAVVHDDHVWAIEGPFIEPFMATTKKRQIRANNFDLDSNIIDSTPFKGDSLAWAQVNLAHGILGKQMCGESTGVSVFTVDYASAPPVQKTWTASECELYVDYHFSNGATEGRIISATLTNDKDDEQASISDGQFRIYIHTGKEGEAPKELTGESRWDLEVDSGTREVSSGHFLGLSPLDDGSHPDHGMDLVVSTGQSNPAAGSYSCDSSSASVVLRMGWQTTGSRLFTFQSSDGGSCTITIEHSASRRYTGTYRATLLGPSASVSGSGLAEYDTELPQADRTLVVHGKFRNFTTQTFHAGNDGDDGALGSDTHGITMTIDEGNTHFVEGDRYHLSSGQSSNGSSANFSRVFDDLKPPNTTLQMWWSEIPMEVGSHVCNEEVGGLMPAMSLTTPANVIYEVSDSGSDTQGSSCTVNVTSVGGGVVEGTYTATLVAKNLAPMLPDNDATFSVSGEFRYPYTP